MGEFRIRIGDIEVVAANAKEAAEMLKELGVPGQGPDPNPANAHAVLLKALEAIRNARAVGVRPEVLAAVLGLRTKALSGKSRSWRRMLVDLGFDPNEVMRNSLIARNERVWYAGTRIDDAIGVLRQRVGQ